MNEISINYEEWNEKESDYLKKIRRKVMNFIIIL